MKLDKLEMNNRLAEEWMKKYTNLDVAQRELFASIKKYIREDLSCFYTMNKIIVKGQGGFVIEDMGLEFICNDGNTLLQAGTTRVLLDNDSFRKIVAAYIDIYEDMYPLGTVVDLKKEYFREILPVDEVEHLRVVINYRFVPFTEDMYIPYMGNIYPVGNSGRKTNGIHFTPKTIERVVHMGFLDEEEIAFLFQRKYELLLEEGMHSTGFMAKEAVANG